MGLINSELTAAEQYKLKDEEVEIDGKKHKIVQLTLDNVAKVEAMISSDSKYRNASDDTKKIEYNKNNEIKYIGSSSYWLKQLKELYDEDKKQSNEGYFFDKIIENIIKSIDNENSTHLNSDSCGREAVKSRIIEVKDKLMDYLEKPTCNNYELINIIKTPTNNTKEKNHFSFATKFCHYACLYLFKGKEEADNFSVFDNVVKEKLPIYYKLYLNEIISVKDYENNYSNYISYIDEIRDKASKKYGHKISRNGFDHLIWYYHKGR